jgi:6-phosphofructokinase 1
MDTTVSTLGESKVKSPLNLNTVYGDLVGNFVPDKARVRFNAEIDDKKSEPDILFEKAGPREMIFFEPSGGYARALTTSSARFTANCPRTASRKCWASGTATKV